MQAGIHDIPMKRYVRDPAPEPSLSHGAIHRLVNYSPLHCWYAHPRLNPAWAPEESENMDIGIIAHALLLDGDESGVVIVDAEDWRTKAAREMRDDARERGLIPVLAHRMDDIRAMVIAARKVISESEITSLVPGRFEQTLLWRDGGAWFRCRPDWMSPDYSLVIDYKTTSTAARPSSWIRGPMMQQSYDVQGALYLRGLSVLKPTPSVDTHVVFLVQETARPFACALIGMAPSMLALADAKIDHAVMLWRRCIDQNSWPGYPTLIHWAEAEPWQQAKWDEQVMQSSQIDALQAQEGLQP